jgi:peptidoglycan/LPS O-acetylase OafA/YrhL
VAASLGSTSFFVISGFVIAGLLFREVADSGRVSLVNFYARRARRILPASTVTAAVTVLASIAFFFGSDGVDLGLA